MAEGLCAVPSDGVLDLVCLVFCLLDRGEELVWLWFICIQNQKYFTLLNYLAC